MKLLAIYFTANNQREIIDGSISAIDPRNAQGKKKRKKKDSSTAVFCEFWGTQDEHDETKLLHMTSRLSICCLCMIRYELFWQLVKMDK